MWVQWEEAGLEPCWVPSSACGPVLMGAHVSPHAITRSLHSFNKRLLNVSPRALTCVQMSSPYSHPPANTSVESDVCAGFLVPPHLSTYLFTPSVPVYMCLHWPHLSPLAGSVYTACPCPFLFILVHICSPLFILPTPVHTCPYLSCLTIIHALHWRSHLPLWAVCTCPYILMFLFLCSGPGQRQLGCSEAEGASDRGLCPALTVLPAAQGAAHGVSAGASRGGCIPGCVCGGGIWVMATPCFRDV